MSKLALERTDEEAVGPFAEFVQSHARLHVCFVCMCYRLQIAVCPVLPAAAAFLAVVMSMQPPLLHEFIQLLALDLAG